MKRAAIVVSVLAIITLTIYLVLENQRTTNALEQIAAASVASAGQEETQAATEIPVVTAGDEVIVKGKVVPASFVELSFSAAGLVTEVKIQEGDTVTAGQLLATLGDEKQIQASVAAGQLELLIARQALETIYREAPVKAAEALLEVVNAPASVQAAERAVNNLRSGVVKQTDIDIAAANVAFSKDKLDKAKDAYKPYADKPDNNLTRASLLSSLAQAQKEYDDSQSKLNSLQGTPSEARITQAEADLALARVRQAEAERKYEVLKNGPDPSEVALAEARIANAQAQLDAAQAALEGLKLTAPTSGKIASISLKVGEYIAPGAPVVMIVDDSAWHVETTNLTELNLPRVNVGDAAVVTFDAFPNQPFPGKITRLRTVGENSQGDITYTVFVDLNQADPRLRWNMTASIVIKSVDD